MPNYASVRIRESRGFRRAMLSVFRGGDGVVLVLMVASVAWSSNRVDRCSVPELSPWS